MRLFNLSLRSTKKHSKVPCLLPIESIILYFMLRITGVDSLLMKCSHGIFKEMPCYNKKETRGNLFARVVLYVIMKSRTTKYEQQTCLFLSTLQIVLLFPGTKILVKSNFVLFVFVQQIRKQLI